MVEVAPGVHRFGSSRVNWYALVEGGRVTLVDAGMPGHWKLLEPGLRSLGLSPGDVEAVVLTHAHADHVGFAERARAELAAPVHVHEAEASRGPKVPPLRNFRRPAAWPLLAESVFAGLLSTPPVVELRTFADGETVDVPGRPRAIHMPGHTPGNCSLLVPSARAVCTGDSIVTYDPFTGEGGPRLLDDGLNERPDEAVASLARLLDLDADMLLPGHGDPWTGGLAGAVARAREARGLSPAP